LHHGKVNGLKEERQERTRKDCEREERGKAGKKEHSEAGLKKPVISDGQASKKKQKHPASH
jgi:hypothetical protein